MRSGFTLVIALATCIAACGNASEAGSARQQSHFTPAEQASLNNLFGQLKAASRRGFDTGDWSVMAALYSPGALACWDASGETHHFSFLSMEPIPDTAQYTVDSLDRYVFGGVDTSAMNGTHFMSVRYETWFARGCELPTPKKWPEKHFYLRKAGDQFLLVHPCPSTQDVEQKRVVEVWPMVSGAEAARIVSAMSAEEQRSIREQVRRDAFPLNAIYSIQARHHLGYEQASLVLDRVCSTGG
ncbi:MAG TPA: hypothetical protein VKB34_02785 [Povalibacter sp.]|nr:hypothetical protein [Povalibacter sp.]